MNLVAMVGRLVDDPEMRATASGVSVCTFRIAVQRRFKDANGERQSDFFSCVAWRQTAEFVARYAHKGDLITVKGELQNRSYEAQDGSTRYVTEIIADDARPYRTSQGKQEDAPRPTDVFPKEFVEVVDDEELPF